MATYGKKVTSLTATNSTGEITDIKGIHFKQSGVIKEVKEAWTKKDDVFIKIWGALAQPAPATPTLRFNMAYNANLDTRGYDTSTGVATYGPSGDVIVNTFNTHPSYDATNLFLLILNGNHKTASWIGQADIHVTIGSTKYIVTNWPHYNEYIPASNVTRITFFGTDAMFTAFASATINPITSVLFEIVNTTSPAWPEWTPP